jgi:hypothetical protein
MNATERDQLQQFLNALRQTRADPKDPTAEELISDAFKAQADAPYLLVQRAMGLRGIQRKPAWRNWRPNALRS